VKILRPFSAVALAAALCVTGCTVGPKYQRADAPVAAHWDVAEPWRESAPKDALGKGEWWDVFHDGDLNALEKETLQSNQTIKVSAARLEQARALAAVQVSTQFPQLATTPSIERQRISGNRPPNSSVAPSGPITQNSFTLPFTISYEVDLFGRRRRSIEAAQANYQSSAADLENVRLIVASELAGDYFSLRQLDTQISLLARTVDSIGKGLDLVNSRYKGGVASGLDVAQEETLLNTSRTQLTLLTQQRKQFEDAIAVLVGKPAPDFHLAARELHAEPPPLNAGLPSDLLERRPDIAEAEREMASANAQIGIAKAAYYPSLNLFGTGGWQAADIAKLANIQSTFWAIGADVAQSIFTGGARRAQVQVAQANYDSTVASYRGTVLEAFREVQDSLTGLTVLDQAFQSQQQAVNASRRTLDIATSRYTGGLVSYLDVVSAQQNLLSNEQELAILQGQKLVTSVLLVKAMGGGWDASSLAAIQVKTNRKDILAP
jgi:NodT family efflux transporter outer membrane factor (OMF) lipoprotein